ncbi:P-loop containing nucleoside triphosphate hydrolase protein [Clohesyomyces aquaticus]|uniref:p-loop containing nucleoside triphosphate hydrolase protein n=1 Tax=Clohesyomyces aquaticus TaxID=1231657 RepID=A0A1Y2A8Q2_9PLEO|nr:P-loop containing nucleoside triphosphate hydrolase protein [Clohesyomyces aquaticus]
MASSCAWIEHASTSASLTFRKPFIPSAKQLAIVDLCRTQNVVVSARPGAGKTATAEAIAAANPSQLIVTVTFSKSLQVDTGRRLDQYPGLVHAFTFHGLAREIFGPIVRNDFDLRDLRRMNEVPAWTGKPYAIVILDEFQDCTDDLFWLVCGESPRLVVLGDEQQAIYGFRGADSRYLSHSSSILSGLSPHPWKHLTLSKSFRLSHEIAGFINEGYLKGENYIVGSHVGRKPLLLHGNVFNAKTIARNLLPLIEQYGPERTAILASSVRHNKPLQLLANHLSAEHRIPIAVLQGKLCVSTIHQFKGRESDLIIFQGRDLPDNTCPNGVFVALTRARKHLVMVHPEENHVMPFVNITKLRKRVEIVALDGFHGKKLKSKSPGREIKVGLHLPKKVVEDVCKRYLLVKKVSLPLPDAERIDPPTIVGVKSRKYYEAVSDLNGTSVMAAFEYSRMGTLITLGNPKKEVPFEIEAQAAYFCRTACTYESKISGWRPRKIQMKGHKFDWLGPYLEAAMMRLNAQFSDSTKLNFEVGWLDKDFTVFDPFEEESRTVAVEGRADIVALGQATFKEGPADRAPWEGESIWEIKFVAKLELKHVIQACIYGYLWCKTHNSTKPPRIVLFNVQDGEKWEIVPRDGVSSLKGVLETILVAKYSTKTTLTTEEFLQKCAKTKEEVWKDKEITVR